jgi:hypothetical protein
LALSRRGAESQVLPLLLARAAARARVCALPVLGSKRARTHGSRARQRGGAAVRDSQCSQPSLFRLGWPRCGNLWWRGSAAWTRWVAWPASERLGLPAGRAGARGRPGAPFCGPCPVPESYGPACRRQASRADVFRDGWLESELKGCTALRGRFWQLCAPPIWCLRGGASCYVASVDIHGLCARFGGPAAARLTVVAAKAASTL